MKIIKTAQGNAESACAPYISPVPGRIPIVACAPWIGTMNEDSDTWVEPTAEDFKRVRECGFNTVMISSNNLQITEKAFSCAQEAGLAGILAQYRDSDLAEQVMALKGRPSLRGYQTKDEPWYTDIIEGGPIWVMYRKVREIDPSKILYMNLAYFNSTRNIYGGDMTYPEYLDYILKNFAPPLWSYDFYPIISKNGSTYTIQPLFESAFKNYMDISKKTGRPFWAHCMSTQYVTSDNSRPAPTVGDLRYEAFSALACGAQGIVYWRYAQTVNTKSEEYLTALVNQRNRRTDVWFNARQVNSEIARFSDVFLGCVVVGLFYRDTTAIDSAMAQMSAISPFLNIVPPTLKRLLVSHIKNSGFEYAVIVSQDPFHTTPLAIVYKNGYLDNYDVVEMTQNFLTCATIGTPTTNTLSKAISLEPGGYAIIRWKAK